MLFITYSSNSKVSTEKVLIETAIYQDYTNKQMYHNRGKWSFYLAEMGMARNEKAWKWGVGGRRMALMWSRDNAPCGSQGSKPYIAGDSSKFNC